MAHAIHAPVLLGATWAEIAARAPQAAAGATWAEIAARAPQAGGNIAPPPGLHDGADKAATWAGTSRAPRLW